MKYSFQLMKTKIKAFAYTYFNWKKIIHDNYTINAQSILSQSFKSSTAFFIETGMKYICLFFVDMEYVLCRSYTIFILSQMQNYFLKLSVYSKIKKKNNERLNCYFKNHSEFLKRAKK